MSSDSPPVTSPVAQLGRRPGRRGRRMGALMAAQVTYGVQGLGGPRATRAMLMAILATSGSETVESRGQRQGGGVLATAAAIGFAAEQIGTRTGVPFGRYAYSAQLGPRLGGVPLLAGAAWAAMARPAWVAAGWIRPQRVPRVLVAATALTAWDVFLDPRMVREGFWRWQRRGRYEGIPLTNFLGWWTTSVLAFALISGLDDAPPTAEDDAALLLYAWTWIGETFANAAFWEQPRVAAAGGLAMGAIAVPALAGRWTGRRRCG
jgi:uncharacterized membrane protein